MNKQKFTRIVRDYHDISEEDRNKLHELVNSYPYSQVLHTLVAKANVDANTAIAKQTLGYAAMYSADRSVLKNVIEANRTAVVSPPKNTTAAPPPSSTNLKAKKPVEKTTDEEAPAQIKTEENSITIAKEPKKRITIDTDLLTKDDNELRDAIMIDLAALKESKASYLAWADQPAKKTARTSSPKTKKSITKSKKSADQASASEGRDKPRSKSPKIASKKAKAATTAKKTKAPVKKKTSTTTKKTSKPAAASSKSVKSDTAKTSKSSPKKAVTPKKTGASKTSTNKASKTKKKESKKKESDQQKLIDKFISKEPSITARALRKNVTDQEDLSVPSTQFTEELISENLAQILVSQGKKAKAIDIYKKLIWKFPQKKAYFAAQIEELKK